MRVSGMIALSMAKAKTSLQMGIITKVNTMWESQMAKVPIVGEMEVDILVSSKKG